MDKLKGLKSDNDDLRREIKTLEKEVDALGERERECREKLRRLEEKVSRQKNQIGPEKCLVGTIRDITERKQAEAKVLREKHFSETLIRQLPGSFYMFAENGRMLHWNDNLEKVTGYSGAEIQHLTGSNNGCFM